MTRGELVDKRCSCDAARWPKCAHPWYLREMQHAGISYRPNLSRWAKTISGRTAPLTAKTDAESVARVVIAAIETGSYQPAKGYRPAPAPAKTPADGATLAVVLSAFEAAVIDADPQKKPNSKTNDRAILARLGSARVGGAKLGAQPVASLTVDQLIAWRRGLGPIATSTWNKYRTLIGQLLRWAVWAKYLDVNPLTTAPPDLVKQLRRGKAAQRRRRIGDAELADLLTAATEVRTVATGVRLAALITAALETGARLGELLALQWRDVHVHQRYWWIRAEETGAGKTGDGRRVDLSQTVVDLLGTMDRDPAGQRYPASAYVFGDAYGDRIKSIDKSWGTAVLLAHNRRVTWTKTGALAPASRAALEKIDLNFHDLRHEAGCRWLESGFFDLAQVSARLGHSSIAQTATYLHATASSIQSAQASYDAARGTAAPAGTALKSDKSPTNRNRRSASDKGPRLVGAGKMQSAK